ncbi:MAG: polyhydroxyalkanoate synthesis regulator DNA-binding domain-containing protein [Candidatus Dormibacteria bacterium]
MVKKYANRKLYDTLTRRYITLDQIAALVRDGHDVRVVERDTGRDLTAVTLSQILLVEEKQKRGPLPEALLAELIQTRGGAVIDYLRNALSVPADLVNRAEERVERSSRHLEATVFDTLNLVSRSDLRRLERRIDRLEQHLGLSRQEGDGRTRRPRPDKGPS